LTFRPDSQLFTVFFPELQAEMPWRFVRGLKRTSRTRQDSGTDTLIIHDNLAGIRVSAQFLVSIMRALHQIGRRLWQCAIRNQEESYAT
jgi:hypothetical protein